MRHHLTPTQLHMALIEQILDRFPDDQRHVIFSFEHLDDGYVVRAMLTLPTGNIRVQTNGPVADHRAAIDQVVAKLAMELERRHQRPATDTGDGRNRDFCPQNNHRQFRSS
jgi:ribosome-associated translation inhibitor RaiA